MTEHSVEGLLQEFAARRLSPVEVLDACAARIEAVDGRLGGFTALCLERAREEARRGRGGLGPRGGAPARGDPVRGQGPVRQRGRPHRVWLAHVRGERAGARRRGGRPCARGRRDPRRQDADARVRLGDHVRQRADRHGAQPVGARPRLGRIERRLGRRDRGRRGAAGARQRHGRLDPRARGLLRDRRAEADLRPDQRSARLAAGPVARPPGADGLDACRGGAPAGGDGRRRRGRSRHGRRPARRRAGRARRGLDRSGRRDLRRPGARSARGRRPRRPRDDRAHARRGRRATRGGGVAGGRADPADVQDDPERRGARDAPGGRALPGAARRVRPRRARPARGRRAGDRRGLSPGVRRPRARPRRVRAPVPVVRRPAHAGRRRLSGPDRPGDGACTKASS